MPAPLGNQFWKNRSKHGRDKLFESPELLWEAACEYFQWCEDNPLIEIDYKGKDATKVELPKLRAFTLSGLCIYLGVNTKYFNDFRDALKGKRDGVSNDFSEVITRIIEVTYNQKFVGAAADQLNANIISRDLGLADKKEVSARVAVGPADLSRLSYDELKQLAKDDSFQTDKASGEDSAE